MKKKFVGYFVGLVALIMGAVSAKPVMANTNDTTVNVVVIGDSISEYMGDCYHSDNYCNYGEDGRGDVINKGQMWYRMMASFLNENGKYHTSWNYNITCVDALGGSMVFNDNSTGTYHTIYHRGGCCVAASTEVVSGINVDYYGESRLGCLDRGVNNHPKAVDLILIEMGTNDAIAQVSYADEYVAYQEMLQRLHSAYPHAAIVCILPSTTISVFPNATWQEVRNAITSAVYSGVVPVSALIDPSAAFGYCYYESDGATTGIHPNSVGQMYFGDIVANAIKDFSYQTIDIHEPSTEYVVDVAPTCTSSGSKSKHCTICNESIAGTAVSMSALSHDFQNYQSDGNETCTQDGTKTGTCTRCGATDTIVNTGSKKGHAYRSTVTAPTCENRGYTTYVCANCNDIYVSDYVNALGHVNGTPQKENITASTCESSGGYELNTYCTRCQKKVASQAEVTAPLGHDFQLQSVIDSSCSVAGVMHFKCSRCLKEKDVAQELAEHTVSEEYTIDVSPTCVSSGSKSKHCLVCNAMIVSTVVEMPALSHDYQIRKITDATCITDGKKEYQCSRCVDAYEETVKATGHSYADTVIVPTCEEKGYTLHTCLVCGGKEMDQYVDALGHHKQDAVIENRVEPTCTSAGGYRLATYCETCHKLLETTDVTESALSHIPAGAVVENERKGSCVEDHVYDLVTYCERCHVELKREHITEKAKGHIWEFSKQIDSTCTAEGCKLYRCKVCKVEKKESISAAGHRVSDVFIIDEQPKCEIPGKKSKHCTVCNAIIADTSEEIPATVHSYKDHITQEATCDKNGMVTSICEWCGDNKETETPKKEHDYYKTTVKPTKTAQGYTIYKCRNCGTSYKSDYVDKLTVTVPTTQTKPSGTSTTTKAESTVSTANMTGTQSSSTVSGTSSKSVWRPALGGTQSTDKSDTTSQTAGAASQSVPVTVVTTSNPKESTTEKEPTTSKETAKKEVVPVVDVSSDKEMASNHKETAETKDVPNVVLEPNKEQELSKEQIKEIERQQGKKRATLLLVPVILFSFSLIGGATYAIVRIIKKKGEIPAETEVGTAEQTEMENLDFGYLMQSEK